MKAYLHFGGVFTGAPNGPFLTTETQVMEKLLWWQKQNLMYTTTGYGAKIPTPYMVMHENRWKRVYCCQYGNAGTCYIVSKGKPIATVDIY